MKKYFALIIVLLLLILTSCQLPSNNKETIKLAASDITLCLNDSYQIKAEYLDYESQDFKYRSLNSNIITVNDTGLITTHQEGSALITISILTVKSTLTVRVVKGLIVNFIDIGQGDAILIELPNNEVMMIDAGYYHENSWQQIYKVLTSRSITTIDYLIISHNHGDHYALIPNVISNFNVKAVYGSGSIRTNWQYLQVMQSIKNANLDYYIVKVGDYLINEKNLKAQVVSTKLNLNEDDEGENPNYSSVMIRLSFLETAFLFTGDAGYRLGDGEDIALKSKLALKADVLKVGHHGSTYSSGNLFLEAVKPKIAVITTSKQTETNHPHEAALNRLRKVDATIYETKTSGTITVSSTGYEITVKTEK